MSCWPQLTSIIIVLVVQVSLHLAIISSVDGATVFSACISAASVGEVGAENQNIPFWGIDMLVKIFNQPIEIHTGL